MPRSIPLKVRPVEWFVKAKFSEDQKTVTARSSNKSVLRKYPIASNWKRSLARLMIDFFGGVPTDRLAIFLGGKTTVYLISKLLGGDA